MGAALSVSTGGTPNPKTGSPYPVALTPKPFCFPVDKPTVSCYITYTPISAGQMEITMTVTSTPIAAPAFRPSATALRSALVAHDKAQAKIRDTIACAMVSYVDACHVAGLPKTEEGCQALGKAVRDCETMQSMVALGLLEKKTLAEYAQGLMRAFYHGVPWTPTIKNDPAMALPWGKAMKPAKAGKVSTTDAGAVTATAKKLLAQARLLGMDALAADLLDVLQEHMPEFTEV